MKINTGKVVERFFFFSLLSEENKYLLRGVTTSKSCLCIQSCQLKFVLVAIVACLPGCTTNRHIIEDTQQIRTYNSKNKCASLFSLNKYTTKSLKTSSPHRDNLLQYTHSKAFWFLFCIQQTLSVDHYLNAGTRVANILFTYSKTPHQGNLPWPFIYLSPHNCYPEPSLPECTRPHLHLAALKMT